MGKILIVEDEPAMQRGLKDNLGFEGHDTEVIGDGESALKAILANNYDLVILDVMLPKMSGFDVLKNVRAKGVATPVIMLTAKGEEIDRVLGLELGADDYVTKPFSLRELLARVKAVLRRSEGTAGPADRMVLGEISVDFTSYKAVKSGQELAMTPKEFELLKFLWEHRNTTVTRDQLLTNVWGYDDSMSTRTVDNFIVRLRQKLEEDPAHPRIIMTVHGAGYRLVG